MSNSYGSMPIVIDSSMASGWRSLNTMNGASAGSGRNYGFRVESLVWVGPSTAGHTFSIIDPNDSTVLAQGTCGVAGADVSYNDFFSKTWRDFKVSQISSGKLLIYYRD